MMRKSKFYVTMAAELLERVEELKGVNIRHCFPLRLRDASAVCKCRLFEGRLPCCVEWEF